eukprot:2381371-Prymnesium_polylepis.1
MEDQPPTLIWKLTHPNMAAHPPTLICGRHAGGLRRSGYLRHARERARRGRRPCHVVIDDTSSGGLRFHVALDRHEIEVPDKF